MSETTTGTMPERLWVQRFDYIDETRFDGWEEPEDGDIEYVRADIFYREFTKLEAVRAVIEKWVDSGEGSDLNNGGGMLEILNILHPSPRKKGTQP